MRTPRFVGVCLLALGLGACDDGCGETGSTGAASRSIHTSSRNATDADSPAPEPYAGVTLPDEADFAAEAEQEINADNFHDKIDELEQELADAGADAGPATNLAR